MIMRVISSPIYILYHRKEDISTTSKYALVFGTRCSMERCRSTKVGGCMEDCSTCRNNISEATGGVFDCAGEEAGLDCMWMPIVPKVDENVKQ
jgi:hypothetical protein